MTATTGLARVTVSSPQRRVDVALPEHAPVAQLLPELLRHAGETLADDGEEHGGWLLRRTGGEPVSNAQGLHQQGIRDGEVLYLVPARAEWPQLEYDDVVDAIAAGARQADPGWSPAATTAAAITIGGVALAVGLFGILVVRPAWTLPLAVAVLLTLAGLVAARAYGHRLVGAALAVYAMPYAFAGGALMVSDGAARLLIGSTALLLSAALGAVGVGTVRQVFVAGLTAGVLGTLGALLAFGLPTKGAAAIVLALLACGIGALPLLAVRLGKLPMPPLALPLGMDQTYDADRERPSRVRVLGAVRRASDVLTGMLSGHALATAAASVVLVYDGGTAGRLLVGVAGVVVLLRARLFATVRQRIPVLVAGVAALAALVVALVGRAGPEQAPALVGAVVAVALAMVVAATVYSYRAPSPYLGRAADLLDVALVVSVVPIACAVLDLYAKVRDLAV